MEVRSTQRGSSLIEVMIAMIVLLAGMLGVAQLVVTGNTSTNRSLRREGASALSRDVLERARQVSYASLTAGAIGDTLRTALGDGSAATRISATSFRVTRRSQDYTVTLAACRTDQASDGIGVHDLGYCDFLDPLPTGAATPTAADLALGLKLGGIALRAVAGGTVLDQVCALLGADPLGRARGSTRCWAARTGRSRWPPRARRCSCAPRASRSRSTSPRTTSRRSPRR